VLHAGDVGSPDVLAALSRIAPVVAVRGNIDRDEWARRLPVAAEIEIDGVRFHIVHILDRLDVDPVATGIHVVLFGHSHVPSVATRDGVLLVNPGSAGPRRFALPVTVGLLEIEGGRPRARIVPLALEGTVRASE